MTSEWHEVPLRELVGYISKGIAPSYAEEASETTIRVLNQKCNRNFRISYGDSRLHDTLKKKVPPERYVKPDDILINSTGAGTAGRIAQIEDVPSATTIDGHMILIRSNGKVTQKFLGYALKAHQWEVLQLDEGSTGQTELNRDRLLDEIMINYPVSFDEQNAIVGTLESIDRKLIVNKEINDNLYAQARAIKRQWVAKSKDRYELLPLNEVAAINPDTYSPKEAWEYVNYLDTSSITNGFIADIRHIVPSSEKLPSRARRKVAAGDVLFSTVRPNQNHFGIISDPLPNMLASTGFAAIRSKNPLVCNELIYLCLTELDFIEKMQQLAEQSTSTFPSIKPSDLGTCQIPCPKDESSDAFTDTLKSLFALIAENFRENSSLATMREALLPKLMSGEIDVSAVQL